MATVNFLYRSTKDKSFLNVRLLYRYNDTDFVFGAKTKFEVSKDYWTNEHKKTKFKKTNDSDELNNIQDLKTKQTDVTSALNKIESHILNAFNASSPDAINKKWLQTQIDIYYNPVKTIDIPTNLVNYIEFYKTSRRHDLKPVMVKRCDVLKNKLERFETENNTIIAIENVNDNFRNLFLDFAKKHKYALSTIKRELVFIKSICNHARKKGIKVSLELEDFSKEIKEDNLTTAESTFVYLNENDIEKLDNINPNRLTPTFEDVRDWLIISIFTGQRISDFMRFNPSMITIYKDKKFIEFTQVKTGHKVSMLLDSKILKILEKNNGQFPKPISDARYNKYVKEVCRLAKIDEAITGGKVSNIGTKENPIWRKEVKKYKKYKLVSSHIGRRSYATNNFSNMPTSILKTITAHKTEAMLLLYVNKTEDDLKEQQLKYFQQ